MKIILFFITTMILSCLWITLSSQILNSEYQRFNSENSKSVLFGQDIAIHDLSQQNQRMVKICCAYNGWLFATFSYDSSFKKRVLVKKSIDNGTNWVVFKDIPIGFVNEIVPKVDIITSGDSPSNLKVIVGMIFYDTILHTGGISVPRFNGITGDLEGNLLMSQGGYIITDVALASDNLFHAYNSNPGSIAILYTQKFNRDSLIMVSSGDGGISCPYKMGITGTANSIGRISISYGRSPSWNSGKYYVAWEVINNSGSLKHIYTAHSEPNFNSQFTSKKCLDSINPLWINQCRNPVVACQSSNFDNETGNFTEVVMFDKYSQPNNNFDLVGCYNLKAASDNTFQPFSVVTSVTKENQHSICFNPFDSTFMLTYYNCSEETLPVLKKGCNMQTPDQWSVVSLGFNDDSNLLNPYPEIGVNFVLHQGITVWTKENTGGHGIALFDAPYINYVGFNDHTLSKFINTISIYPNPSNTTINFQFEMEQEETISISVFNLTGKMVKSTVPQKFTKGIQIQKMDLRDLITGSYYYRLSNGRNNATGKLTIIRN